jgi:hypothetical protein
VELGRNLESDDEGLENFLKEVAFFGYEKMVTAVLIPET